MVSRYRCTLITRDGAARRVDALGIVIGREAGCDIVVDSPTVSRRHALVRVDADGAELVALGRSPILVNGAAVTRHQRLADGDVLEIASLVLTTKLEAEQPASTPAFHLLVRDASYGIRHSSFRVGGASDDDVILDGWPAGALTFHLVGDELFVESTLGDVTHNGQPIAEAEPAAVAAGDVIGCLSTTLKIGRSQHAHTTVTGSSPTLPFKIVVELLPRGGRVVFSMPSGDHCLYLADRRLDLIAALLRPPKEFSAGDFIPDDVLRPLVWPGNPGVNRSDINVHITRCRKDLVAAGLPGPRLLQRSPGGGATRLALEKGCEVIFI